MTVSTRRTQQRSEATRRALLDAALAEFALRGFDGASTIAIAERANTHQPQINYHFGSKRKLWEAVVDDLFRRLDEGMAAAPAPPGDLVARTERVGGPDAVDAFADGVWRFVHAVAGLPELNRLMVHEAMAASERLDWIVERHARRRFDDLVGTWAALAEAGVVEPIDELTVYYGLVGAASLRFVNDAEARRFRPEAKIDAEHVAGHARFVIRALLAGATPTPGRSSTD